MFSSLGFKRVSKCSNLIIRYSMERKGQKIPGPTCSILITAVILYLALRTKYGQRSMLDLLLVLFRGCLQQSSGEGDGTPLQYSCLKNPMDGGAWWAASPWGREEFDTTERLPFHLSLSFIGEGNGNPLQCSCLQNPRDRGAWWAAVYGVTQSRTRLKRLSSSSSSSRVQ